MAGHGENRQAGADAGHHTRGTAGFGHGNNRFTPLRVVGRVHGGHRNCFFRIVEGHIRRCLEIFIRHFSLHRANPRHCFHGFRRILASSGFCESITASVPSNYGVCHVHHFRTGRHRVSDHGFHHLGCCDHDTIQLTAATNQFSGRRPAPDRRFPPRSPRATITTSDARMISSIT